MRKKDKGISTVSDKERILMTSLQTVFIYLFRHHYLTVKMD